MHACMHALLTEAPHSAELMHRAKDAFCSSPLPQAFAPGAFGCCNKVSMGDVYWRREQWAKEPLAKRPPGMLIHRVQE